ncbi:MAG: prepilin-type N-terminal cleavage/methylation domain-containing protein [Candidatus Omnitrophota bacterium]
MRKKSLTFAPIPGKQRINTPAARGFTLMEILVVIIIVAILATLAINQYRSYKEHELDKEAQATLRLIMGAEKIYRMEIGGYYASGPTQPTAISNINTNLRLSISTATNRNWDYITTADNASPIPVSCTQATRNEDETDARTYRIRNTEDDPVANSICP